LGKNLKLEVPYNSRVNVSFVFDKVKNASLILSFEYLGNNYSIGFENVNCNNKGTTYLSSSTSIIFNNGCLNIGLKPVCFNYTISNSNNNFCDMNISFLIYQLIQITQLIGVIVVVLVRVEILGEFLLLIF
jgi:hypothetical protein